MSVKANSAPMSFSVVLADEAATVSAGRKFGEALKQGAVVYLEGVLGAGKTTFCRGVLQAFGHSGAVKSPTYTLVEPYVFDIGTVYHFDLYRLGDPEELEYMGIRDYFQESAVCLVEWPVRGEGYLPCADIVATLSPLGDGRRLDLQAINERGAAILILMS
jgi:ATPase, YjeE family